MGDQAYLPGLDVSDLDLKRVSAIERLMADADIHPCAAVLTHEMTQWPICNCGADDGGLGWSVQTDGVHASELCGTAEGNAKLIAAIYTGLPWLIALVRRLAKDAQARNIAPPWCRKPPSSPRPRS